MQTFYQKVKLRYTQVLITATKILGPFLSAILLMFACSPTKVFAQATTQQRPHPAVVRVIVPMSDGSANGSGTLIDVRADRGLIITNAHVVRNAKGLIVVVFPDGYQTGATLLKIDKTWDLAALAIWKPDVEPVKLATLAPRPGDTLKIAGYGSGFYRAATGRCTKYFAPVANQPKELVEVNVTPRNGDSGGPIFNQQNELAGVLFGGGQGYTMGSYSPRVRKFLSTLTTLDSPLGAIAKNNSPAPAKSSPLESLKWQQTSDQYPTTPHANILAIRSPVASNVEPETNYPATRTDISRLPAVNLQSNRSTDRYEVASRNNSPSSSFSTSPTQLTAASDLPSEQSKPPTTALPEEEIQLLQLLGDTPFNQAKSVLAVIGLIAVLLAFFSMFAERAVVEKQKPAVAVEVEEE